MGAVRWLQLMRSLDWAYLLCAWLAVRGEIQGTVAKLLVLPLVLVLYIERLTSTFVVPRTWQ